MITSQSISRFLGVCVALMLSAQSGMAEPKANQILGAFKTPSPHQPTVIGFYSKGCLAGGTMLPESGPTWQAMRLSRNRNWGHPETIDFLQDLSRFAARQKGWEGLYIGDISQPRGGPMTSGHASHQNGLDADIWMLPPNRLNLSRSEREALSSISVRSADQRNVNGNWTAEHMAILRAAAEDDRVDRIFVTPPVKIAMCNATPRRDRAWLQKVRPYWGHHYHFHVRLKCPEGADFCEAQAPSVAELSNGGDGCDASLNWWVTDALAPPDPNAEPAPPRRSVRDYVMADLPPSCGQLAR